MSLVERRESNPLAVCNTIISPLSILLFQLAGNELLQFRIAPYCNALHHSHEHQGMEGFDYKKM